LELGIGELVWQEELCRRADFEKRMLDINWQSLGMIEEIRLELTTFVEELRY
jgi:hypothetical protein